jgi:hypothetical protein
MDFNKIEQEFNALSAKGQWQWVVNSDLKSNFKIMLDNDTTDIWMWKDSEEDEDVLFLTFKEDIGDRSGLPYLLETVGIKADWV